MALAPTSPADPTPAHSDLWEALRARLSGQGVQATIVTSLGERLAQSTDNSLYQITPDAVLVPRNAADASAAMAILAEPPFRSLSITPRGGLTGTNGQSLNTGLVVDTSRHLTGIGPVDLEAGWVEVEAGVVLDDLNRWLSGHDLMFAPTTSTANRCALGGMIGTDAAGKGSRVYGKTSDNLLGLELALADGSSHWLEAVPEDSDLPEVLARARDICRRYGPVLAQRVPRLPRRFAGYDLIQPLERPGWFDPTRLIAGAEGTLGLVTRARLKLTPKPAHSRLVVVAHDSLVAAVDAAGALLADEPTAVETLDDVVVGRAREEGLLDSLPTALTQTATGSAPAWNFVEFTGNDDQALAAVVDRFVNRLSTTAGVVAAVPAADAAETAMLWGVRKTAVGLLAGAAHRRQPVAMVEDCIVPPSQMGSFIRDFLSLLEDQGLRAGMFGHVDVGCMHIRPAFDFTLSGDRARVRPFTDAVEALTRRHGGYLWGEHGKGVRGEYLRTLVGEEGYDGLCALKAAFDPDNRMNPGKIAAPDPAAVGMTVDGTPMRADHNAQVPEAQRLEGPWRDAFRCNGNAACLSRWPADLMCPSYQATRDRRHSPKGRADLIRAWAAARAQGRPQRDLKALGAQVEEAMAGCLGCNACASKCPIHVSVPTLKSHFLHQWVDEGLGGRRSLGDRAVLAMESVVPRLLPLAGAVRAAQRIPGAEALVSALTGLVDLPRLARPTLSRRLADRGERLVSPSDAEGLDIVLLPDLFTYAYDPQVLVDALTLLQGLGFKAAIAAFRPAGKAQLVLGDRQRLGDIARDQSLWLSQWQDAGVRLTTVEATHRALLAMEYQGIGDTGWQRDVESLQAIVSEVILSEADGRWTTEPEDRGAVMIFGHCTEVSADPNATPQWARLLRAVGFQAETPAVGCCGMAGAYGHRRAHQETSRTIWEASWSGPVSAAQTAWTPVAATGFSCRSQIKRFSSADPCHPVSLLAAAVCPAGAKP